MARSDLFKHGILLLLASLATACSQGGDNGSSDGTASASAATELDGRWTSNCADSTLFGSNVRRELIINAGETTRVSRVSVSGNCSDTSAEIREAATLTTGREISPGVKEYDVVVHSISVKPMSETGLTILNSGTGFCGFKDWRLGVARSISGTGAENCYPVMPVTLYDVYSLEGDRLYFGEGEAVKESSLRPVSIDRKKIFYTRQ